MCAVLDLFLLLYDTVVLYAKQNLEVQQFPEENNKFSIL